MNIPATTGAPSIQVIRLPQVCEITGLCRSAIYQLEAEQKFPRRVHLGRRSVGWIAQEVQMWLANRIELSRGSGSPPLKIQRSSRRRSNSNFYERPSKLLNLMPG